MKLPEIGYDPVLVKSDTPEWELERRASIGASDVPAVLGLSKWDTPRGIYLAKHGHPRDFDPLLGFVGHASEAIIQQWVEKFAALQYPEHSMYFDLIDGFMARSIESPWLHASFDRVWARDFTNSNHRDEDFPIVPFQFKTAHQYTGHHWDEGVPLDIEAQVQTELYVAGAPFGFVVVWIGGREFRLFRIDANHEWVTTYLLPTTRQFWVDNVLAGVEPMPTTRQEIADVFPSMRDSKLEGSPTIHEVVDQRAVLLADRQVIDEQVDALQLVIAQYMESHDVLTRDGVPILTYRTQQGRRSADLELLAQHPRIYAKVVKTGAPFKVMRTIKPKQEKK